MSSLCFILASFSRLRELYFPSSEKRKLFCENSNDTKNKPLKNKKTLFFRSSFSLFHRRLFAFKIRRAFCPSFPPAVLSLPAGRAAAEDEFGTEPKGLLSCC